MRQYEYLFINYLAKYTPTDIAPSSTNTCSTFDECYVRTCILIVCFKKYLKNLKNALKLGLKHDIISGTTCMTGIGKFP